MKRKDFLLSIGQAALLMPLISSCKKILDQPVLGSYETGNFFTNDQNVELAINAAYPPLTFTDASSNAIWVLGDVASDDAIKGGLPGDQADFKLVNDFNINPSNSAIEAVWKRYYDGIFRCNVVLDGLSKTNSSISKEARESAIGQAKFLRAYYYFILTNCYGDIPLHLKVGTPEELQTSTTPRNKILEQIEKDCQDASELLPKSRSSDLGRPTKGATLALLAKAYLFEQKWEKASTTVQTLEDLKVYSLLPNFDHNFNAAYKNNEEAIFSVWHVSGASPFQGNTLNQWFAPRDLNGYGFFYPTQSLVDNFEVSNSNVADPRLDYTVARKGQPYFDKSFDPSWTTTGYLSKKSCQPLSVIPKNVKGDGSLNYEAIRFADLLLVKAEALNEQPGKSSAALIPLNRVRKRARESYLNDPSLPGYGTVPSDLLPDITTTDQGQLREIIRRERRSELALEFHRFFDVVRYGKQYATDAMKDVPNFNYDKDKFFPIPQSERDTNKKLELH